ncbi:TonB-dependent receptor [Sphingobacterium siyangense]|uniref:Iron complex outermembrane receptor protein n=1 Tax=Sphingobacterium siyangense TaxID=459529 RepID=A0A562MGZ0_9SPHI|nr:TonB-dependent receptor [Sphingobacterium siyangense]TWI19142.1 iron complex outermembrane receptor protein [Sphingobacterium siyangense]
MRLFYISISKKSFFAFLYILLLSYSNNVLSQTKSLISGTVLTSEGKPADNVSVYLLNTSFATATDDKGNFELKAPIGTYSLVIKQIGAKIEQQFIEVKEGVNKIPAVVLNMSITDLQEISISSGRINKFTRKSSPYVTKMPLKNLENSQVYSSISKELLKDQQINNLDEALKNAAGVSKSFESTGRAGSGGTTFVLRGFVTQSKLRNGLAGNITTAIDAANVESIEVLKGPSATLFGNSMSSYGGLINRVTKKPFKSMAGEVAYYTGSYGLNRLTADFNTPIDSLGKLLFRMNAAYNAQNGFQENAFRKSFLFAPSISYQVNDKLSFLLDAEFNQLQSAGSQFLYFSGNTPVSQFGVSNAADVNINYRSSFSSRDMIKKGENANVFGQMNYQISKNWKSQSNISLTTSGSSGSSPYYYLIPGAKVRSITSVKAPTTPTKTYNDDLYLQRMVWEPNGTDLNMQIQQNILGDFKVAGIRNRLTVGFDYLQANTNITYNRFSNNDYYNPAGSTAALKGSKMNDVFDFVSITNPGPDYYKFNQTKVDSAYTNRPAGTTLVTRSNTRTYSAFVADVVNITENLNALLSLRIDRFVNKGILNNSTNVTSDGYKQTAYSPKFGLVYQILPEQVSLFANYQNGFVNKTGTDFEGKTFKPEQANQLERGVKFDLFKGILSGNVSYYDIKVKDIVRAYELNPQLSIQNGTQSSKGVEIEVIANPIAGLNLIAGYGYNDSRYTNTSANLDGLRPVSAGPKQLVNFWMSYRVNRGVLEGLGAGFGGNYASKNYAINTVALGQFILPSYEVYNAALFYDQKKYRIGLKMNNIGNTKYWVGNSTMNPQMLREVIANISFKF